MKYILTFSLALIFLLTIMASFVNSEQYLWNDVIVNTNASLVNYHAFYWFDDTSAQGIGKNKAITITLWSVVEPLPLNITDANATFLGEVDWCNYTIKQDVNNYISAGELNNTEETIQSYYFTSSPLNSTQLTFNLKSRDTLVADMICHYTTPASLYAGNILAGRFTTFMPSFACSSCEDISIQEQISQVDNNANITANQLSIYKDIQTAINWNFELWLIGSWILKIFFVFVGVGLIFATFYFFYKVINDIAKEI